jgi:[CysO sulfur-carrier protein]-S-L-cysteine hydrolase
LAAHRSGRFHLGIALGNGLALVALLATLRQPKLHLGSTVAEVHLQRNEREPFLHHASVQSIELFSMQKQFAGTTRLVRTEAVSPAVRRNVDPIEPAFLAVHAGIGVDELHQPLAHRLHLGPLQHDAGFERVEDGEVVLGLAIRRNEDGVRRNHGGPTLSARRYRRAVLRITTAVRDGLIAGAYDDLPNETCGLLGGNPSTGKASVYYPCHNTAASSKLYTIEPRDHLRAERDAEDRGLEIIGVVHSHTHTEAYPSPTDVAQAPDPSWHYVIVSLKREAPVVRSYRIVDDVITEEPIDVLPQ